MNTDEKTRNHVQNLIFNEISSMVNDGHSDTEIVNHFQRRGATTKDVLSIIMNVRKSPAIGTNEIQDIPPTDITARATMHTGQPQSVDITDIFSKAMQSAEQIMVSDFPAPQTTVAPRTRVPPKRPAEPHKYIVEETTPAKTEFPPIDFIIKSHPTPIEPDTYPTQLKILDRTVDVTLIKSNPDIVVLDNVLTEAECREFIEFARPQITPSNVVDRDLGTNVQHEARTSSGATFTKGSTALLQWIEQFCVRFIKWPYERSEGFQVLNYQVGQRYLAHNDYFDKNTKAGQDLIGSRAGNRNASLLIYLNDVEGGGGTQFPKLGLTVMPKRGRVLFFGYPDIDKADELLHAGMPPTSGEKWVAVNWYRQGQY